MPVTTAPPLLLLVEGRLFSILERHGGVRSTSAYGGLSSTPRRLLVSTISQVACSPVMWKTAVSGARASAATKDLIAFFLFFLGSFVLIFRACLYLFYLPGSCL